MLQKIVAFSAWCAFGLICFVTLSPIGLRPETGSPEIERFFAFALLGVLFSIAYPQHLTRIAALVLIAAFGLEVLQHLTPDRHGHLKDALVKLAGGWIGCTGARLFPVLKFWDPRAGVID